MLGNGHVQFGGGKSEKCSSNRATRWLPILRRNLVVCYLEFGKFSNNLHYVDYERLPIEEFSENGGSIPHNLGSAEDGRPFILQCTNLPGDPEGTPNVVEELQC